MFSTRAAARVANHAHHWTARRSRRGPLLFGHRRSWGRRSGHQLPPRRQVGRRQHESRLRELARRNRPAGPRHNVSVTGRHALVARSRGRFTPVFESAWAYARHHHRLLIGDCYDQQALALLCPTRAPPDELPREGGVLEGSTSWVRAKVSELAWRTTSPCEFIHKRKPHLSS